MIDLEVFKKNYLVIGLTDEQVQEVASLATLRRLTPQQVFIRAGEQSSDLFVVMNGRVAVLTSEGDKLNEVTTGSVIGEIALIDAQPRTADVIAIGLVDVAVIPAQELRRKMNQNREWGFLVLSNLARVLCARLRQNVTKLEELYDKTTDVWDRAL
jgi:CRP/FNR family cyclic AMP-dependent transcriptional regulator